MKSNQGLEKKLSIFHKVDDINNGKCWVGTWLEEKNDGEKRMTGWCKSEKGEKDVVSGPQNGWNNIQVMQNNKRTSYPNPFHTHPDNESIIG